MVRISTPLTKRRTAPQPHEADDFRSKDLRARLDHQRRSGTGGWRARSRLEALADKGRITRHEHEAGERFRRDHDLAHGVAGETDQVLLTGVRGTGSRAELTQAQSEALRRHRETCDACGAYAAGVLKLVTIDEAPMDHIGAVLGMHHTAAMGVVKAALARLVEVYDVMDGPKAQRKMAAMG